MKTMKLILTAGIMLFLCTSCEKDQNGNWATYYKTIGEGYIWDATNNRPLVGASITIQSCFRGSDWFGKSPTEETFYTDENGYYQLRFMKRTQNDKVDFYLFEVESGPMIPPPPYWSRRDANGTFPLYRIYPEDIKDKKIITFDTVEYYKTNF